MRLFIAVLLCCAAVSLAFTIQRPSSSEKRSSKQVQQEQLEPTSKESTDPQVGTTKGGKPVYRGKKGGYYVLTPQGRKRYVKESEILFTNPK